MVENLICNPSLEEWCCEDLRRRCCDWGVNCECSPGRPFCGRPYLLTDDSIILRQSDLSHVSECPHCGAEVVQG